MTHTGSCLCGAVTYAAKDMPAEVGACHCEMCRKHSGGIFIGVRVPADNISFEGEDNVGTFKSSEWAERSFCKKCGSTLYYHVTAAGPESGVYHLGFGTLDDQSGFALSEEIFIDRKPEAYAFAGETKTMTAAEVFAMFAPPDS